MTKRFCLVLSPSIKTVSVVWKKSDVHCTYLGSLDRIFGIVRHAGLCWPDWLHLQQLGWLQCGVLLARRLGLPL